MEVLLSVVSPFMESDPSPELRSVRGRYRDTGTFMCIYKHNDHTIIGGVDMVVITVGLADRTRGGGNPNIMLKKPLKSRDHTWVLGDSSFAVKHLLCKNVNAVFVGYGST